MKKQLSICAVVLVAALAVACSDDDGGGNNNNRICGPGSTQVCNCPGGTQGVQTCNITGESWSTCNCGGTKHDGGGTGKKSVGKFCHNLVDKDNKTITLTLKIGSGSSMVSLSAWTGACSTVVGVQCHQLPSGNNMPLEVWYDGQVMIQGSATIGFGEEWVIVLTLDKDNKPEFQGGSLKTGYTCQSLDPWK